MHYDADMPQTFRRDLQYYKFCAYGFLKNLRFFEPFIILFFVEKGFTFLQIGVFYTIREIATNILEIPTGVVADALGRRRTMVFSFASYIVSFAIFFIADSFGAFATAMVLFAFGEAFRTGTHKAMILAHLKINGWQDQKVHYYGRTRSWSQIGSAVSALIAGVIVFFSPRLSVIFAWSIIPYVLDLGLMISYPRSLDGPATKLRTGTIRATFLSILKQFAAAFSRPRLIRAIGNVAAYGGFFKAMKDYLQPVLNALALSLPLFMALEDRQRSAMIIGAVYAAIYLLTSSAARHSGRVADLFRNLALPLNLSLLMGLGFGLASGCLYRAELLVPAVVCYLSVYLAQNLRRPIGVAYVSDMLDDDILATALSAESQLTTLIAAVMAPLVGWLADSLGVGAALAITSAGLLALSPLLLLPHGRGR